jgi:hypothetical protein
MAGAASKAWAGGWEGSPGPRMHGGVRAEGFVAECRRAGECRTGSEAPAATPKKARASGDRESRESAGWLLAPAGALTAASGKEPE